MAKLEIEDQTFDTVGLAGSHWSFLGKHVEIAFPYKASFSLSEVINSFAEYFDDYFVPSEFDGDDIDEDSGNSPELEKLRELDYPTLEQLLVASPKLAENVLSNYFRSEFLGYMFPVSEEEFVDKKYYISTLDSVLIDGDTMILVGKAILRSAVWRGS